MEMPMAMAIVDRQQQRREKNACGGPNAMLLCGSIRETVGKSMGRLSENMWENGRFSSVNNRIAMTSPTVVSKVKELDLDAESSAMLITCRR